MQNTNEKVNRVGRFWPGMALTISVVVMLGGLSLAQQANREIFPTAEQASQALFAAVETNKEEAIMQVLGGGKELVSSGDNLEDQHDREMFAQKYREMHRLVEEPDGTTLLYIGAENWPFPVPLISKNGKWYFDADAGTEEVRFRRIGENEANTIQLCQRLATNNNKRAEDETNKEDAAIRYAQNLIDAKQQGPLHGYYFRRLESGKARSESVVIAYPAEYRSSGVMTFVVVPNGMVYEKDFGPKTTALAKALTTWKPDRTWHIEQ